MRNRNFPTLITSRLFLDQLSLKDVHAISYLRSDLEINKFVERSHARTKKEAIDFINKISIDYESGNLYYWAIRTTKSRKMIGSICLWNISEDSLSAEVGYDLMTEYQGFGYMNEALEKVIDFGIITLKFETIYAYTHHKNIPSLKLLKKNRFKLESEMIDKGNINNVVFSYTKS